MRPFLKWPGGKFRLIERITKLLPQGNRLIEPFVGGGAVFLNTHFDAYLLNDANSDLINLYTVLQQEGGEFIRYCKKYFKKKYNVPEQYYKLRTEFNYCTQREEKSALFLYLNRHGYNGLCRYNQKLGHFNVPFGQYSKPYFPELELNFFYQKTKKAIFTCEDFTHALKRAKKNNVIYCDPPYVPLSASANFTQYQKNGFSLVEQKKLAEHAKKLSKQGIPVVLSNHCTEFTQEIYKSASLSYFPVQRLISCKAENRKRVIEILALFE